MVKTGINCSPEETMQLVFRTSRTRTLYIDEYKNGHQVRYVGP